MNQTFFNFEGDALISQRAIRAGRGSRRSSVPIRMSGAAAAASAFGTWRAPFRGGIRDSGAREVSRGNRAPHRART